MNLYSPVISGSLTVTGSTSFIGNVTMTGTVSATASNATLLDGTGSVGFTTTASFLAVSSSQQQISSSQQQISSSLLAISRSYASTGSNTFTGLQNFSNTCNPNGFTSGASIYTAGGLQVTYDAYFSSSVFVNGNLTVYGTQSVVHVSSSQFNVGTNIITVNTSTPAIRYGGLSVYDSGSTGLSGSIFWDSEANHWIYANASGSGGGATYSGGMFISGPRSSGLGCEQGTTACRLLVGQGGDHLTSSMIYHSSTCTNFYSNALFVSSSGCIGIGTSSPSSLLEVQNCINTPYLNTNTLTSGQWLRISNQSSCTGVTSGILFQAQGPGGGNGIATINAITVSCGSMTLAFGTRDSSGNVEEKMRILSSGTVAIGTQTQTPIPHSGASVGGLIVQGLSGNRGLIEVWDATSGKAVFQQSGGTTYIGNLCKGTSGGDLRLLINGNGSTATEAMVITCSGRVLINNSAQNGCADYSRLTISGGYAKTNNCTGFLASVLHLATCENDFPFGAKFGVYGDSCSTNRYLAIQTGDHNISNQGNISLQASGGNVGIGNLSPLARLQVGNGTQSGINGAENKIHIASNTSGGRSALLTLANSSGAVTVEGQFESSAETADLRVIIGSTSNHDVVLRANNAEKLRITTGGVLKFSSVPFNNYHLDTSTPISVANGGTIPFETFSGLILINNMSNGNIGMWMVGAGSTVLVSQVYGATVGTMAYSVGINGYIWTAPATANYGVFAVRTRANA
jgi:hypothetical protein